MSAQQGTNMFKRKLDVDSKSSQDNLNSQQKPNLSVVPDLNSEHQTNTDVNKFDRSLQESTIISLSDQEWKFVHDNMNNPPNPGPKLREAFKNYSEANA